MVAWGKPFFETMSETPRYENETPRKPGRDERFIGRESLPIPVGKEKIRKMPESLQEAFKSAADVAISRIMKRVASPEGMSTDAKAYRNEIIAVLRETDAKLPE